MLHNSKTKILSYLQTLQKINRKYLTTLLLIFVIISGINNLMTRSLDVKVADGLTKTSYDATTQSTTTTNQNQEVKWVNSLNNETTSPALATITDPILVNQTYQPNSFQTSPGWTKEYSTNNGLTFSTTEPSSGVNVVKTTGLTVPGNSNVLEKEIQLSIAGLSIGDNGNGDGFKPIIYGDMACASYHATPALNAINWVSINCLNRFTGAQISGYPSFYISTSTPTVSTNFSGNLSSNSSADILTFSSYSVIGTNLYYAAQRLNNNGINCWNLVTARNCGFVNLTLGQYPDVKLTCLSVRSV